jgi:hypothetical protein
MISRLALSSVCFSVKGFKTAVRLENKAFGGVNQSFETLHEQQYAACFVASEGPYDGRAVVREIVRALT